MLLLCPNLKMQVMRDCVDLAWTCWNQPLQMSKATGALAFVPIIGMALPASASKLRSSVWSAIAFVEIVWKLSTVNMQAETPVVNCSTCLRI